ncbi:MAG: sigma 54-interacting transcriptional regulator [Candidatus Competibacterales bacterium]
MATHRLNPDDRRFFALAAQIILTNPFSVEWSNAEALIAPKRMPRAGKQHVFDVLDAIVSERLEGLASRGIRTIAPFEGEERQLLTNAYLFWAFNRTIAPLDELINAELTRPGAPQPAAAVVEPTVKALVERGFGEGVARRYAAFFYQLRRAYYFIDRSLVGASPSMVKLRLSLWNSVFTFDARLYERHLWNRMEDFSTLMLGETGTGKGAAAAAIGRSGFIPYDPDQKRFASSFTDGFLAINLTEFAENLIESELFGHRKGAFTGAVDHHKGIFERCGPHSTLFLDEIGDVSLAVQTKLLRVLQERTFAPVGSHQSLPFKGRVIAATHRSLGELRWAGRFRDDFFYRLCSDIITVPSLRQRLEENPAELEAVVRLLLKRILGSEDNDLCALVLEVLHRDLPPNYPWPGNVRELEQAVRRILLTRRYTGDPAPGPEPQSDPWLTRLYGGQLSAREVLGGYCRRLYRQWGSLEAVARASGLDRRTVKKYLQVPGADLEDPAKPAAEEP